jgi:hypothetical protein
MTQPLSLHIESEALRPLIGQIVREVLTELERDRATVAGRMAYSEEEAARLIGLEPHVLRDERRRGRIAASSIVGRRIRYTPADLASYLAARRVNNAA